MADPYGRRAPSGRRTNFASCVVAVLFLVSIVIVLLIVYLTLFKPKDPKISVTAIKLPSFNVTNDSVSFTFSQFAAVSNPNRAEFSHYDSTIQLLYYGNQVGFMFIPAGRIEPGQTRFMAATFSVHSFPLAASFAAGSAAASIPGARSDSDSVLGTQGNQIGPTTEIESRLKMAGRLKVLQIFSHYVAANSHCRVAIAVNGGSVLDNSQNQVFERAMELIHAKSQMEVKKRSRDLSNVCRSCDPASVHPSTIDGSHELL